jgi:hypothetical protein
VRSPPKKPLPRPKLLLLKPLRPMPLRLTRWLLRLPTLLPLRLMPLLLPPTPLLLPPTPLLLRPMLPPPLRMLLLQPSKLA